MTKARSFDNPMQYVTVKTGELGTIDLSVYKSEGNLYGYVDCVRLKEAYPENDEISSVTAVLKNYSVTDENGIVLFGIDKGGEHRISGTVKNMSSASNTILIKLEAFNGSDELSSSQEISVSLSGGEEKGFNFISTAALSDGAYFKLTFDDGKQNVSYMLSDLLLEKQYNGDSELIFKDASVRNIKGELISELVCGQFNLFEIQIKNSGTEKIPMRGILAIYDAEEKLLDVLIFERNIIADSYDRFLLGAVLPSGEGVHAKLFAWENLESLVPVLESYRFD